MPGAPIAIPRGEKCAICPNVRDVECQIDEQIARDPTDPVIKRLFTIALKTTEECDKGVIVREVTHQQLPGLGVAAGYGFAMRSVTCGSKLDGQSYSKNMITNAPITEDC